ncbi:uncharacterized protein LOC134210728 isoform X1 [Armigeres subalbatus]|uniref:uncharacterized protein LOC134210728 isoform X1 n=1 Tax=Armigeres subalbatus TaxID=124917 RepID=UPI002ED58575
MAEWFRSLCCMSDEPAEDFILDVKLLAESCGFGVMKDSIIRDRLVLGAYDIKVRERLLEEEEPSLEETERIIVKREQMQHRSLKMEQTGERVSAIERSRGCDRSDDNIKRNRDRSDDYVSKINERNNDHTNRNWDYRSGRRESYPYNNRRDQDRYNYRSRSRSRSGQRWKSSNNKNVMCSYCKIRGHVRKNCFKLQRSRQAVRFVAEDSPAKTSPSPVFDFKRVGPPNNISDSEDDLDCMSITVGTQELEDPSV